MKRWLALALLAWAPGVLAQWAELSFVDPSLRWRTLETAHFTVHFAEQQRAQARTVAGAAERILPGITALLRWRPESRIHVVVLDSADFANGLASPLPFNYTMVFLSPPDEGELAAEPRMARAGADARALPHRAPRQGARRAARPAARLRAPAVPLPQRAAAELDRGGARGARRVRPGHEVTGALAKRTSKA